MAPGAMVAGYRIERVLGRGSHGVVYEATQLDLERRVALRVMPGRLEQPPGWPDGPHVVALYASGDWEQGSYLAMRLVRGKAPARFTPEQLGQVVEAIDSAHAREIVHGSLSARNVLVDAQGQAFVTDFGLEPGTIEEDRAALARLEVEQPRRRTRWALLLILVLVVAAALVLLLTGRGGDTRVPAVPAGAEALGSALSGGGVRSVDCEGQRPSGSSFGCTLLQTALPGRRLVASHDGVIRDWVVRGAQGDLSLQVLRGDGAGRFEVVGSSPYQHVSDRGVHELPANLHIRAGERLAVEVGPESVIGVRDHAGSQTWRFIGPLRDSFRAPAKRALSGFDHEVLVRVDYAAEG